MPDIPYQSERVFIRKIIEGIEVYFNYQVADQQWVATCYNSRIRGMRRLATGVSIKGTVLVAEVVIGSSNALVEDEIKRAIGHTDLVMLHRPNAPWGDP